jgi:hypothetical protein
MLERKETIMRKLLIAVLVIGGAGWAVGVVASSANAAHRIPVEGTSQQFTQRVQALKAQQTYVPHNQPLATVQDIPQNAQPAPVATPQVVTSLLNEAAQGNGHGKGGSAGSSKGGHMRLSQLYMLHHMVRHLGHFGRHHR